MSAPRAALRVLSEAGTPLHVKEITRRILEQRLWTTPGKTPHATVNAQLSVEIQKKGAQARFRRKGRATFELTEAGRRAATAEIRRP
jgi:hypothetical protein